MPAGAASIGDLAALTDIYRHSVAGSKANFASWPTSASERRDWLAQFPQPGSHQLLVSGKELGYTCSGVSLAANQHVVAESAERLLGEFDDLKSESPTVIAFGRTAHLLAAKHLPAGHVLAARACYALQLLHLANGLPGAGSLRTGFAVTTLCSALALAIGGAGLR